MNFQRNLTLYAAFSLIVLVPIILVTTLLFMTGLGHTVGDMRDGICLLTLAGSAKFGSVLSRSRFPPEYYE